MATIDVTSVDLRGSITVGSQAQLDLEKAVIEADSVQLKAGGDWHVALQDGLAAVRLQDTDTNGYDVFLEAQSVRPGDALKLAFDPKGRLPDTLDALRIDAHVAFDRPWDRLAFEQARPQPIRIDLRKAAAQWGKLDLRLAGTVDIDGSGMARGDITVQATNWQDILRLGSDIGVLPRDIVGTLKALLGGLARSNGRADTIDVPLTLSDGYIWLGVLPLGRVPALQIR